MLCFLIFFITLQSAEHFELTLISKPPTARRLICSRGDFPVPHSELIFSTYGDALKDPEAQVIAKKIELLESHNSLFLERHHLTRLQAFLTTKNPDKIDALNYFFTMITAQVELEEERENKNRQIESLRAHIAVLETIRKNLERQSDFFQETLTTTTEELKQEKRHTGYLKAIALQSLARSLTIPRYDTEDDERNLIIDRSCTLCHTPIKDIVVSKPAPPHLHFIMPCCHFFCAPCHTQWMRSENYQSRCPLCRQHEDRIYFFNLASLAPDPLEQSN